MTDPELIDAPDACVECGNDEPAEGYDLCLDCLIEHGL